MFECEQYCFVCSFFDIELASEFFELSHVVILILQMYLSGDGSSAIIFSDSCLVVLMKISMPEPSMYCALYSLRMLSAACSQIDASDVRRCSACSFNSLMCCSGFILFNGDGSFEWMQP